jgi:hypothetical protein
LKKRLEVTNSLKEKSKPRRPITLTKEQENTLFKYIIQCNNEKKPVIASEIVNYVFEFFGQDFSVSWVDSLVKRHADKLELRCASDFEKLTFQIFLTNQFVLKKQKVSEIIDSQII